MKIIGLSFFLFPLLLNAQGLTNNSAKFNLISGSYIYVDGDANGGITNLGTGTFDSDGIINLEGNWTNNASNNVFINTDNTGSVLFSGTTLQQIGGTALTDFENLTMSNSGAGAYISFNQQIEYELFMADGDFDLRNNDVQLVQATSTVTGETTANRIKSTDGLTDGQGTGTIYTIRNNPNGNIANLGLNLVSAMTGNITISRGHLVQSGSGSFSANGSVFRYFQVSPATNGGGGLSVTFQDCYAPELNGHNPAQLIMFQWIEQNSSGIEFWTPLPDNTSGAPIAITQTLSNSTLNYYKVTLGSVAAPLPVELTNFSATCSHNGTLLKWSTASEINNDYFTIKRSDDGENYYILTTISGNNTSHIENNYQYVDSKPNTGPIYYQLSQTDYNGDETDLKLASAYCSDYNSGITEDFFIINNPAQENVQIQITGIVGKDYTVSFVDQLGRQLTERKIHLTQSEEKTDFNIQSLSEGIYNVVFYSNSNIITKQLIIIK